MRAEGERVAEDSLLQFMVAFAREAVDHTREPKQGELVVEVSGFTRPPDPDAIGFLVHHGEAPYNENGSGPKREVWDVRPFSGRQQNDWGYQRWENAQFRPLKTHVLARLADVAAPQPPLARDPGWPLVDEC